MQICDLKALTDIAHAAGALVMVDNSIMTPVYQRPLELGADISMVSMTKFVGGHSDVTGGILSFKDAALADQCAPSLTAQGFDNKRIACCRSRTRRSPTSAPPLLQRRDLIIQESHPVVEGRGARRRVRPLSYSAGL